jgi:knotted carbamoyltransferase YgeW
MTEKIQSMIQDLGRIEASLYGRDPLLTWEQPDADVRALLLTAEIFEKLWRANIDARVFRSGLAVSLFRDQSTRTRFSFASAASLLGLSLMDLDETKTQVAHGETVRETANMISFLTEAIGIRDDMYIGEGHETMREVADAVQGGFEEGVLPQRPVVVNLQCDRDHPTQTLADLMHLQRTFGSLDALRGKKIAMSWAYSPSYGKPLSVPQGIVGLLTRFGMEVVLAHPVGYDLMPDIIDLAGRQAEESGGSFEITHNMEAAFAGADVVYPKSWAPFEVMEARTRYLRSGRAERMDELERQAIATNAKHQDWECNEDLMATTEGGRALYMHCLPADITGVSCEHGEVSAEVFDRYRVATYQEAEHKPYVMAAMMLLARFQDPAGVLARVVDRAAERKLEV